MLAAYLAAIRREKARAQVFLVEMIGISPANDAVFDSMLTRIAEHIVPTLDPDGTGPLHRDPPLGRGVASGLMGIAMRWIRGGYNEPLETVTEAALMLCTLGGAPDDTP
jgi:hypothetical protein